MKKIIFIVLLIFLFVPSIVYGKAKSIEVIPNYRDKIGVCNYGVCAGKAIVDYGSKTVTYYMQFQPDGYSCAAYAAMSAINAIKNTTEPATELRRYAGEIGSIDTIKADNIEQVFEHFGVKAKVYHSDITKQKAISLIYESFNDNKPVLICVRHSTCPDLANSHHALMLIGTDEDDNVVFLDSGAHFVNAKKRTVEELVNVCLTTKGIMDSYYSLVTFGDYGSSKYQGGSVTDAYKDGFVTSVVSSNNFDCKTILVTPDGDTEFKKLLDGIFLLMQILAPIIAIIFTIIDYIKVVGSVNVKKANIRTIKRVVIATIVVFLPFLLDLLFHLFGLYDLSTCGIGK